MASPPSAHILDHIKSIHTHRLLPNAPIYGLLLSDIEFVSASPGQIVARLPLARAHLNSKSALHGSVTATIIDWVGGLAIASTDLRDSTGVSTDIHISYVGSAREGDALEIEGNARKVGGSLAFTDATIWKLVDGERGSVVAFGSHTKFVRVPTATTK